jgi:type I restriction enzyme M protein
MVKGVEQHAVERVPVRGRIDDIRTAVEGEDEARGTVDPFEHKLIRKLLPEYLAELEEANARKAEPDARVKAAAGRDEEEEGGGERG